MTIIVKKNYSSSLFKIIKEKLNNLELVSLPTETVYGLAGLGTKIESAKKIYKLKERPLTPKVNAGDEPISNTMLGLDGGFRKEIPALTKLVDMLPFIETKKKSMVFNFIQNLF